MRAPDRYAAEVISLWATRTNEPIAYDTRRPDMGAELRVYGADLLHLVHRSFVNFALCIEAGSRGPLMQQVQERARFPESDRSSIGKQILGQAQIHPAPDERILRLP